MLENLLRRLKTRRERHQARQEMKTFLQTRAGSTLYLRGGVRP